ncbi:Uncharacterised protein [Corynebacterium kutscheri]|uniref:hypothetical protein n=1 Tax=Corynebacterium kutscheri TaxID=35755 RepID=UPI000F709C64|nr:hypothetical protein [Corynebacterium kutscheri]VEH82397.1 Uncharacterised protein [Corynebacterium kutscheri]
MTNTKAGEHPNTPGQPNTPEISDTYVPLRNGNVLQSTDRKPSLPHRGELTDPSFGEDRNESNDYLHKDKPTYPIRNRNWGLDYYNGGGNKVDRPIRGPQCLHDETNSGRAYVYKNGEQGLFYSRDNVQYAWRENGKDSKPASDLTMRASEFLMGGGFNDGVFYGAEFHATDASSTSIAHTANYKNSGKPSFRLFIDDILNTEDPGWTVTQGRVTSRTALYFVSPDGKIGLMVEQSAKNTLMLRFYDNARIENLKRANQSAFDYINQIGVPYEMPLIGIRVPGWKRTVISFGTTGEAAKGDKSDKTVQMTDTQGFNAYRSAYLTPVWDRQPGTEPADLTVKNCSSARNCYHTFY